MLDDHDLQKISEIIDKKITEHLGHFAEIDIKNDLKDFIYKIEEKHYTTKYDIDDLKDKIMYAIKDELNKFFLKIESKLNK